MWGRYPYRRRAHRPSASCRIPCASHTRSVTFAATSLEICSSREIGFFRLTGWPQGTKLASTLVAGAARRAGRTARGRRGKGTFYPQRGISMASVFSSECQRREDHRRRRRVDILWRNARLYSQMAPPILVGSGGLYRIGSFLIHSTN